LTLGPWHASVIVELGGLGGLGIARLRAVAGVVAVDPGVSGDQSDVRAVLALDDDAISDEVVALEAALAEVTPIWAAMPPTDPIPGPARLGQLRRRFHDLGAVNPYAVEEYFALGYVPEPRTNFLGARKLPPAPTPTVKPGAPPPAPVELRAPPDPADTPVAGERARRGT